MRGSRNGCAMLGLWRSSSAVPTALSEACRARANQSWSLSPLTMPHALVRVVLAEQIYRAMSLLAGHPYHRG